MIHMGSDHRCVMAICMITMLGKIIHIKRKHDTIEYDERDQAEKTSVLNEMLDLEKRYQEIVDT